MATILIVDDQPGIRELLSEKLIAEGYVTKNLDFIQIKQKMADLLEHTTAQPTKV